MLLPHNLYACRHMQIMYFSSSVQLRLTLYTFCLSFIFMNEFNVESCSSQATLRKEGAIEPVHCK